MDDILIEAINEDEAIETFRKVLQRCREKNIKLARHKLEAGEEVDFAGTHIGGDHGYRPTQAKISALIDLPHPTNITELRSFLGMWNQMRMYVPDLNHSIENMKSLLKKDVKFIWDEQMDKEFKKIKEILKSPLGLKPYRNDWKTVLYTDFSSQGVGFALTQENPDNKDEKQLIFCDSVSLSNKQKKLPALYGENLGLIIALERCRHWLKGAPKFTVRSEQQALASIYNKKSLEELSDEISDIVVSSFKYNFEVEYIPAKNNLIADFLSRNPLWAEDEKTGPTIKDDFGKTVPIDVHTNTVCTIQKHEDRIREDPLLEDVRDAGSLDETYTAVIKALREGKTKDDIGNSTDDDPCRDFHKVWEKLGILDEKENSLLTFDVKRLVIPISKREEIMKILHLNHQGATKTYAAARSRYFWPSMKEDAKRITENYQVCKELNPRPRTNPNIDPETPKTHLEPFESIGLDMFSWKGDQYLLIIDRMSGFIFVEKMGKHATARGVTERFKLLCLTYGMPRDVRYDKGPQFSSVFEEFLTDIGVEPTPSSAGNSSANGLSEAGVKSAKLLLRKSIEEKVNYAERLCHFNQSPRADGYSPSELFLGRRIRSYLPTLDNTVDIEAGKAARERTDLIVKDKTRNHSPVPPLELGDLCYRVKLIGKTRTIIENPCQVVEVRKHGESYFIKDLITERIYLRNRKFIKHSEKYQNMEHKIKNMETVYDQSVQHIMKDWSMKQKQTKPPSSCMKKQNSVKTNNRVKFDSTCFLARVQLERWRKNSRPTDSS